MSVISFPKRFAEPHKPSRIPTRNITNRVKCWGRRGIFFGGISGIALGAIFVTIPLATDVLAFGAIGTLLVGAVECAVIGGGFAALGAMLLGNGRVRGRPALFERTLRAPRHPAGIGHQDSDIPLVEWPSRWTYPVQPTAAPLASDKVASAPLSLTDVQASLNTIDAWENGNTGP